MKKILVPVATGFEDVELITTLDVLFRAGFVYDLVSIENKKNVCGKYNACVKTKKFKNKISIQDYCGIFLHGGPGHKIFLKSLSLIKLIQNFHQEKKLLAGICAAPSIFLKAGVLENVKFTSFPNAAPSKNNTSKNVEIDGNIITGKDYTSTLDFANLIVNYFR